MGEGPAWDADHPGVQHRRCRPRRLPAGTRTAPPAHAGDYPVGRIGRAQVGVRVPVGQAAANRYSCLAWGSACSACNSATRARPCPRSPSSWRSARPPCGGRCGGWWPVGWTRWRIGPELAAHPGSATMISARSRSCCVRPPGRARCGPWASWPQPAGVQVSRGRLGRCCASAAAAGPRPAGRRRPDRPVLAGGATAGQPSHQQLACGQVDHRLRGRRAELVVLCQPTGPAQPCKRALHHPTAGHHLEGRATGGSAPGGSQRLRRPPSPRTTTCSVTPKACLSCARNSPR